MVPFTNPVHCQPHPAVEWPLFLLIRDTGSSPWFI